MWVFVKTSTNFAHLASFQAIEFVDRPGTKALDIFVCQTSNDRTFFTYKRQLSVVHEEREHELISSPVSTLPARTPSTMSSITTREESSSENPLGNKA